MKARVNTFLNIRTRSPEILPDNNPNESFFKPGDVVEIVDTVVGQEYKGNDVWHKLDTGIYISNFGVDIDQNLFFTKNTVSSISNDLSKKITLKNLKGKNGRGITVGVLDSGIDIEHRTFKSALKNIDEEDKFLSQPSEKTNSHGTKVAGLLVGNDDSIAGLIIDSFIRSYRVIKNNQRTEDSALKLALKSIIDNDGGMDIINLSLDIQADSFNTIQKLIDDIAGKGIIIVVAAGSFKHKNTMAGLKNVIRVGVFEMEEFSEIKNKGLPIEYHVSFLNAPILTTGLSTSNKVHEMFNADSAYTAIVTGIIGRFLSNNFISKSTRFDKVKSMLFECSFNIQEENQPVQLKSYRNEST